MGWTSIGTLSELWVGGRRVVGPDSDWGEHLRTTGPGPRTTLDLTCDMAKLWELNFVTNKTVPI
jgi:hypothetical protein